MRSSNDRRRRRSLGGRSLLAMTLSLVVASCGSPARRAVDPAPIALGPPHPAPAPPAPGAPTRPRSVALWAHVAQPDALVDMFGLTSSSFWSEIAPYAEVIDLAHPIDVFIVAPSGNVDEVEPVFRVRFKDTKALFALFAKDFRLREEGDRVIARPGGRSPEPDAPDTPDAWECDFARGSDAAVCGIPKAVAAVADWAKPGPAPPAPVGRAPLVRVDAFAEGLSPLLGDVFRGTKVGANDGGDLAAFLSDVERFSFELAADRGQLNAIGVARLRSQASRPARELLASPNAAALPEVFHRVVDESENAVFLSGGGPMPAFVAELVRQSQALTAAVRPDVKSDAASVVGSFVTRPAVIGYGVRLDRARSLVASARIAKDSEKAVRALDDAIEPQLVYALAAPVASIEHAMHDVAARSPANASLGGAPSLAVRSASPTLGLPKGSFFAEEKGIDWTRRAGSARGAAGPAPVRATYTLFVPAFDGTLGVTCAAEPSCVEAYRRLTAKTSVPRFESDLFQRPGLVAAGWASSSTGVRQENRITLKTSPTPVSPDVLANIERDLLAPRHKLPFVVTTKREGAGGTITAEMRGSRDAFRAAVDQGLVGSSWSIARMLFVLFGGL